MTEELVRPFDVAILFGLSTQTITNRAEKGEIPGAVFIGKTLRFDIAKVRAFIESGGQQKLEHNGKRDHRRRQGLSLTPAESSTRVAGARQSVRVKRKIAPVITDGSVTIVTIKPGEHAVTPGKGAQSFEHLEPERFSPDSRAATAARSDIFARVKCASPFIQ